MKNQADQKETNFSKKKNHSFMNKHKPVATQHKISKAFKKIFFLQSQLKLIEEGFWSAIFWILK